MKALSDKSRKRMEKLAARDGGWTCHLCREPIDPKATGDRRPTRDHVIPRAAGGVDALVNLKLAHYICNFRRGASLLD